ncbi:MAG: vitamin K epoxide reductase family protein [Micrococcaceae bacterium]
MSSTRKHNNSAYPFLLTLLSAIAFWASFQLVLERIHLYENPNYKASCDLNPFFSCTSVMETAQAKLFGFPNPILGIIGFAITGTIGMMLLTRMRINKLFAYGLLLGTLFAFGLSIFFWYAVIFQIHHFCLYCMVVWACTIPIFILTISYLNEQGFLGSTSGALANFKKWNWPVIILLYLVIYGGIWLAYLKLSAV